MLKVAIAGDHAGFEYKQKILHYLQEKNYQTTDFGPYTNESVDYPDTAHPLAMSVETGEVDFGVLICGSGNGVAITANKHQKVRAGLAWNIEVAQLIRKHNDANVIAIPARFTSPDDALALVITFLQTEFEGGRHATRVNKIPC
ncbi:MAG: RpiB/LacA/LacB family sugar-phosphate isomerase [Leadbetterella sp.]